MCVYYDNQAVWVVNGTIIVNSTLTLENDVIIDGDLVLDGELVLDESTITITGCPDISGSLTIGLTPENIQEIETNGQTTFDALFYNSVCDVNEFNSVGILNEDQCEFCDYGSHVLHIF